MGNAVFERFNGRQDGTLWYYNAVHAALGQGWASPLLDRLGVEVKALVEATQRG